MLVGGLLLLTYQYCCNYKNLVFRWADRALFLQVSFFQYYAAFILEFLALQWLTSSKACLIFNLSPFVTALISFFLLNERLSFKKCMGLIIGFMGFIPILLATPPTEEIAGSLFYFSIPELLQLGSVFCASYGWIMLIKTQNKGYGTVMINAFTMTMAGIAALVTSLIVEGMPVIIPPQSCLSHSIPLLCKIFEPYGMYWAGVTVFLIYTLALVIIANVIGFNLYGYLLSIYSATFVSFAGFITPLFAALFGWLFLGEVIGWPFILTAIIVFCGLLVFYQEELKSGL